MNIAELSSELTGHARGMWRFRWRALAVAWLVAAVCWAAVFSLPDIYEARASVSVDTNSLLPALTKGLTASENPLDAVGLVSKAILTRPNLEMVARSTDLDLRTQTTEQFENLITRMQQQIQVQGGRDNVFKIAYADADREKAKAVVTAVLDAFVESALGAQGNNADMTEKALAVEIEDHERRLGQAESDLAAFKRRHVGFMPDDGADYYHQLQSAEDAVATAEHNLKLVEQRREEIQRQLKGYAPADGAESMANCSQAEDIEELNKQLADLSVDFTNKHPRILILRETISSLEEECRKELGAFTSPVVSNGGTQLNPVYQSLQLQLSSSEIDLVTATEALEAAKQRVAKLRENVDRITEVETDLKRLNRDYNVIATRYQELIKRWESLQSKKRIDPVTDALLFNILEPPFVSAEPVSPNRLLLLLTATVLAFGAAGGLAFILNQFRPVFFTRRSLEKFAHIPVLGSVSLIASPAALFRRKLGVATWATGSVMLLVVPLVLFVLKSSLS